MVRGYRLNTTTGYTALWILVMYSQTLYRWIQDLCDKAGVENVVRCFVGHLFSFQREHFVHELQSLSAIPKIFDGLVEDDITSLISYLCDCYPEMIHDKMRR